MNYFKNSSTKFYSLQHTFIGLIALLISFTIGCTKPDFQLYAPTNGIILNNNMPTFSWEAIECDYYEIWIDGIRMDEVPGDRNVYTPFALSFGDHQWQALAVSANKRQKSTKAKFTVEDQALQQLPATAILLRNNWKIKSSLLVEESGEELTLHTINTKDWYTSSVPVTVLSALIRNGVYPNPNNALNNLLIPDANDEFNKENDLLKYSHIEGKNPFNHKYWFRNSFSFPKSYLQEEVWLNLGEINYRAEIWINGYLVADSTELVGMERHFRIPVTKFLHSKGSNLIAIAIYPPDHIGKPSPPPITPLAHPGRNLGLDALITKDYTKWDVLGWDWQPSVRDRDMGITEDVYLTVTDQIEVCNLYVTADLPLPDTTQADVTISADIVNLSEEIQEGTLTGSISINDEVIKLEQSFKVKPGKTISIYWDKKDFDQLHLSNPKLWWPFEYGEQNLYNLKLTATTKSGEQSIDTVNFGIREVETYIGNNERVYKINGENIYMKGGNWVIDMMLNWTASRYDHEIRLTKASGLNMLRVWGPTGAAPQAFYDAADKHGVLIWQDFLNDFWGTFLNDPEYTPEVELFKTNSIAMVKKYRNHPSLVMWCGGNEGPNPKEELIMNEILPKYDGRDSKHYLKISNADGVHGGGPYHTLDPKAYFNSEKMQGFSSELGPSGVPVFESMEKFMLNMGKDWKPGQYPLNSEWTYHDATDRFESDERKFTHFDNLVRNFYGAPDSTSVDGFNNYVKKCQLVNYEAYRSCIEAINCQLWENSSGYALWKSNSSWPSVVWQVYDWYMQAHAGFYATQKSNEPIHIQLNRQTLAVDVLNASLNTIHDVKISAVLYNANLEIIWDKKSEITLSKNAVSKTGWIVPENNKLSYLVLKIEDRDGKIISNNFYWLNETYDFKALNNLTEAKLNIQLVNNDKENSYTVTVQNDGEGLAFMTALRLVGINSGNELLPSYWNNNYFSILPGEKVEATVTIDKTDLTEIPAIEVQAYNMKAPYIVTVQ